MAKAPTPESDNTIPWKPVGKPRNENGVMEETFAAPVAGGTILRVKRTGINRNTLAPIISDAMVFVPGGKG